VNKRRAFDYGILGLFLLLFFLTTVSHDYFCHEELHTVCGPLHSIFIPSQAATWGSVISLPPSLAFLTWSQDQALRPEFIKNIFHPPD
jgi:hypothetical protein